MHRYLEDRATERAGKVAELWLKGFSQGKIAAECDISRKAVRWLLDKSRALWLERRNIALTDAIAAPCRGYCKNIDEIDIRPYFETLLSTISPRLEV